MARITGISWCDHTFNGIWGCTRVSEACQFCYAEEMSRGWPNHNDGINKPVIWGKDAPRRTMSDSYWQQPIAWDRDAKQADERRRVFAYSMGDWAEDHPTVRGQLMRLWKVIRSTPHLDWLLLTKRPERIAMSVPNDWGNGYANVWLGTTVEKGKWMTRASTLAAVPSVVHFLSIEPMLEQITIPVELRSQIEWIIVGGESGANRRRFDPVWAMDMRDQCKSYGIAFWMKQMSALKSAEAARLVPPDLAIHQLPRLRNSGGLFA